MISMSTPDTPIKYFNKRVGRNVFESPPKVSVVIPAYNCAEYIAETIDSVLKQKFREHEIIVVNDGSPDSDKLERALKMQSEDIIYIKQRNAGPGVARNLGIEHARGEIIAFLDADDVWQPEYLASQLIFMERHNYDMVYCDALLFGMQSAYRRTFMETAPSDGEANFESILDLKCNVITSGAMVRKRAIIAAGMFETERVQSEDFVLWLRIAKSGAKIGYQPIPLLKYRVRLNSFSGDALNRAERALEAYRRVGRTFELSDEQRKIVDRRIAGFAADLSVERGKALLLRGDYQHAVEAFQRANTHRRSLKLATVALMTRVAPSTLLKFYKSNRSSEIAFIPVQF
jgi:glycosyltransferase involved in cell wall biosynthesis